MATLEKLGGRICDVCGKPRFCYDVGSAGIETPKCAPCYASAVGHGGMPQCWKAAVDFITEAIGEFTPEMSDALAYYYKREHPCAEGCEHGLF